MDNKHSATAPSYLRLVDTSPLAERFPFNDEAREAARRALDAQAAADLCQFLDRDSIGAPGTKEKLLEIIGLLNQVAAIARSIESSPEERHRFKEWEDIYDNPRRPETFGKSPERQS